MYKKVYGSMIMILDLIVNDNIFIGNDVRILSLVKI